MLKNILHAVARAAVTFCVCGAPLFAQSDRQQGDSTFVVLTGTGVRFARPNAASMVLAFDAIDSTRSAAARRVALRSDNVRQALEKLGISRDSVVSASNWYWWRDRVDSLQVAQEGVWDTVYMQTPRGRQVSSIQTHQRTMWRVRDRLQVRIGNPSIVGRVFDALLALGISDISDIKFIRTADPALADTLLSEAVRDARRRAELLAAASGMRLDRLIELNTRDTRSYYDRDDSSLGSVVVTGMSSGGGDTEIRPADLRISATVFTRWRLAPR
jgi:uncharacterized protein YggE